MQHLTDILFWVSLGTVATGVTIFLWKYRSLRKEIEDALKNADTAEQELIRKKLVKALFPPRFPRN